MMCDHSHEVTPGRIETNYFVAGHPVCQLAWCQVHGVSQRRVCRVLKLVALGQKAVEHGNKGKQKVNTKTENAKIWMERYFHLIGDKMPNSNQIHLPSWDKQKDIFLRYCKDMEHQGVQESKQVCLSMFYWKWNKARQCAAFL